MDYFIIVVTTLAGILFHAWLFVLFRRWVDRDLALSIAGEDPARREWMLERLAQSRQLKIRRRDLEAWLRSQAAAGAPAVKVPAAPLPSVGQADGN
ncbi:hypothetical protein [Stutzerimonas tarimensis]|uniref:30S ribosomal protein S3 n=1 Tax=Stutzerimonas tarimensis TaxID=1507735 RepID=A0ABV7T815_9GAMM